MHNSGHQTLHFLNKTWRSRPLKSSHNLMHTKLALSQNHSPATDVPLRGRVCHLLVHLDCVGNSQLWCSSLLEIRAASRGFKNLWMKTGNDFPTLSSHINRHYRGQIFALMILGTAKIIHNKWPLEGYITNRILMLVPLEERQWRGD